MVVCSPYYSCADRTRSGVPLLLFAASVWPPPSPSPASKQDPSDRAGKDRTDERTEQHDRGYAKRFCCRPQGSTRPVDQVRVAAWRLGLKPGFIAA